MHDGLQWFPLRIQLHDFEMQKKVVEDDCDAIGVSFFARDQFAITFRTNVKSESTVKVN